MKNKNISKSIKARRLNSEEKKIVINEAFNTLKEIYEKRGRNFTFFARDLAKRMEISSRRVSRIIDSLPVKIRCKTANIYKYETLF